MGRGIRCCWPGGVINGHRMAELMDGARLVEFPGAAHMLHLEQPDRFIQLTSGFLADADAASPMG